MHKAPRRPSSVAAAARNDDVNEDSQVYNCMKHSINVHVYHSLTTQIFQQYKQYHACIFGFNKLSQLYQNHLFCINNSVNMHDVIIVT